MRCLSLLLTLLTSVFALTLPADLSGSAILMIRSFAGPSGKAVGRDFVLDEIRNRFVYPQDNSLVVYFEWQVPPGDYTLTAYWKDPEGRTFAISPDIKMQTTANELNAYWTFMIDSNRESGVWTAEIKINGEPAGSQSFELVMPERPMPTPAAETLKQPTLDELYKSLVGSLVWVYKLDDTNRRIDASSGFVVAPGSVLTAFQSIDTAAKLEIEFASGARVTTDKINSCSRMQDWAIVKVETGDVPPLQFGNASSVAVGERLLVFGIGAGTSRTIGGIDISGRIQVPRFGERITINPQLPGRAVGGPLLDLNGKVVGIIGGSLAPGALVDHRNLIIDMGTSNPENFLISITPTSAIPAELKSEPATLRALLDSGILTPRLSTTSVFSYGGVTNNLPPIESPAITATQFSRRDPSISVFTFWGQKEKIRKGTISTKIYDAQNKLRIVAKPQSVKLSSQDQLRSSFTFVPRDLEAGLYRIDVFWDGLPVWRAFISITE
jgi:S1-C subfamily serine protease